MKTARFYYSLLFIFAISTFSCRQKAADRPPSKEEVYHFFMDEMKQTATAGGYLKYKLVIDKYDQDVQTGNCNVKSETVPCFRIQIDRTEYLDNYTGTYVSVFKNDVYHLYRDEQGKLTIADHTAGQTSTEQHHRVWRGNRN